MDFVDRDHELATLRDHLTRPGGGLFVLYGRRRIGKTALIQRAIGDLEGASYHVATRSTIAEELARLSASLARTWKLPLLEAQPLTSVEALLALLRGTTGPRTLVIDELPYLIEADPSFPGQLQAAWDQHLSSSQLKLVVCGSSVGIMSDTFFGHRSPLYGRRTGQLRLGPLAAHHLAAAFPWRPEELVELAAAIGGVPGYLQRLDPALDLLGNLATRVLRQGEALYEEVPFLLREELREPRVYQAILAAIAGGARKFGEISSKVGLDRANLSRYLGVLTDLGLVEREVPVTERRPDQSRKGLYRISDPFVATWFRFVHPHRDRLERGLVDTVVAEDVAPNLQRYLSHAVEPVLTELMRSSPLAGLVDFEVAAAGRYWSPSAELDLVLVDPTRRRAFIAEVKWSRQPVSAGLLDRLRERVASEAAFAGVECTFAVISRNGCTATPPRPAGHLVDISAGTWMG